MIYNTRFRSGAAWVLFVLLASLHACAQRDRLIPKDRLFDGLERRIFLEQDFNRHGMPLFTHEVKKIPENTGPLYYLVDHSSGTGRPARSFLLMNAKGDNMPSIMRPLKVVYTWTGKGFKVGAEVSRIVMQGSAGSRDAAALQAKIALTSFVTITATGFAIGLVQGTVDEIHRPFFTSKQVLVEFTEYSYDPSGRIIAMTQYTPAERPVMTVKTTYVYRDESTIPYKTWIESFPDNRTRELNENNNKK
jgi:hypothetical protein